MVFSVLGGRMRKTAIAAVMGVLVGLGAAFFAQPASACSRDGCCKHCGSTSRPCGDTCIASDKVCHVGSGCACY